MYHSFVVKGMHFLHHFTGGLSDKEVTGRFQWLNGE